MCVRIALAAAAVMLAGTLGCGNVSDEPDALVGVVAGESEEEQQRPDPAGQQDRPEAGGDVERGDPDRDDPDRGGDPDRSRACFELVYPLAFLMPDGSIIAVSSDDEEGYAELKAWHEDNPDAKDRPALQYPVDLLYPDGTSLTILDDEEMARAKEACRDKGDRDPDRCGDRGRKCEGLGLRLREMVANGELTPEEARERYSAACGERRGERGRDCEGLGLRLREDGRQRRTDPRGSPQAIQRGLRGARPSKPVK